VAMWSFVVLFMSCVCVCDFFFFWHQEYATARKGVKLDKNELLRIYDSSRSQPCSFFGLHPKLSKLQALYNAGDAAMVANIGSLIEPVTLEQVIKHVE